MVNFALSNVRLNLMENYLKLIEHQIKYVVGVKNLFIEDQAKNLP
jgi:hypothetical protein